MFPLRSTVATPTFRPQSWGLADGEVTAQDQAKRLEKDVKDIAIKAAAAQMALQIGLMFVPVIGWALGAIISLVQFFVGKHYEKRVKQVIANTTDELRAKASQANQEVSLVASQVYDQEYQSAITLAASGVPLEGNFFADLDKKILRPAASVVRKVISVPTALVVTQSRSMTGIALKQAANLVEATGGSKSFADDIRKFEQKGDKIAADMEYRAKDPKRASDLMSGKEMSDTAESRAADLKATAFKEIDLQKNDAIAKLRSADGRTIIRKQTALALRGDPETLARVAQLQVEEAQLRNQLNSDNAQANAAISSMEPTLETTTPPPMSKTTVIVGTSLAAVAAFLAFR